MVSNIGNIISDFEVHDMILTL